MGIPRGALKIFFLVLGYLGSFTFVFWVVAPRYGFVPKQVGAVGTVCWIALLAAFGAKLMWLHAAWKAIPDSCRLTAQGEHVSPDDAAAKHLKPTSAIFWQFPAHVGLAEATNAVLASYDTPAEASTRLPFIACASLFIPGVNLIVFPVLLFLHMRDVDAAHREMERCLASQQHARGYVPPEPPTMLSFAKVIAFSSILLWLPMPFFFIELVKWTSPHARDPKPASGPVKTPAHVELHSDRIAEAMTSCARLAGNEVPKSFEACPNVKAPLQLAIMEGGARYEWTHGTLIAWWPGVPRVYAKRHVSCDAQRGCSYEREKYGL